jgi:hypothetical protein
MPIRIGSTFAICALLLAGCATPYQSAGIRGGYQELQLDENVFQVSFNGNALISGQRVADYTLLRSAEVAQAHGFAYFAIIDAASYQRTGTLSTPQTTYGSASVSGNSVTGSSTTYGGGVTAYSKPSSTNTIVCFKEKPEGFSYAAGNVIQSLRNSYRLD